MPKIACVAVVKNEERHIAEWIAYQFALGFDTVILYDNQSTDGTVERALEFAGHHDIRIIDWHLTSYDYQTRAYENVVQRAAVQFDWLACFDTDEFLVLEDGLDLKTCLAARGGSAAIAISWAMFGSSGHDLMPDGLIIENFLHRAPAAFFPNRHIKSIIRPQAAKSCINAHMFKIDGRYTDLAGRELDWQQPGILAEAPDYKCAKLHHYFTRSRADWEQKMRRGYHDLTRSWSDFKDYDRNEIFDDTAARAGQAVAKIRSALQPSGEDCAVHSAFQPAAPAITTVTTSAHPHGFVLGWEWALLGNRLSSAANLLALAERTGVPTAFPQLMETRDVLDFGGNPEAYIHSPVHSIDPNAFAALTSYATQIFAAGNFDIYMKTVQTMQLSALPKLQSETGIIVFISHRADFQDLTLHEAAIKTFCGRGNGIILPGAYWHQYLDLRNMRRCGDVLRAKFKLGRVDMAENRRMVMLINGPTSIKIGIHMRGADYRDWLGGEYYFTVAQYLEVIRHLHERLGVAPHCFYIFSNDTIDGAVFAGLPICVEPASAEDDFAALAKCDYVVGPPSTFGTWAAFLGGAKRIVITSERLATLASTSLLECAVEVIFPTGSYLPGDPACRPI